MSLHGWYGLWCFAKKIPLQNQLLNAIKQNPLPQKISRKQAHSFGSKGAVCGRITNHV